MEGNGIRVNIVIPRATTKTNKNTKVVVQNPVEDLGYYNK